LTKTEKRFWLAPGRAARGLRLLGHTLKVWNPDTASISALSEATPPAVYSGLLRMADLLALQPNMDIRLHIVGSVERRASVVTSKAAIGTGQDVVCFFVLAWQL